MASRHSWLIDFHCDTLSEVMHSGDSLAKREKGHLDAARLAEAGVSVQVFALFSNPESRRGNLYDALAMTEHFWQAVDSGVLKPILWREDMAEPSSVPGGMLSIEGGEPLGTDPQILRLFFRMGIRAVGLTWNGRNSLADGVGEAVSHGGLTKAGRTMVAEMNRLGMLVDVSHLSETGFWDVVDICQKPFIASHSNCKTICNHQRNLTDEQMRAIAAKGGVVGINFLPAFLSEQRPVDFTDIVRHAEHMLEVMGRGHVGLGSDYDGIASTPVGLEDVTTLPRLRDVLAQHFGDEVAAEIMGGSFARLLAQELPERPGKGASDL